MNKEYLIIGGQMNGEYIKTNGASQIRLFHKETIEEGFERLVKVGKTQEMPLTYHYKLTVYVKKDSSRIKIYRLHRLTDQEATLLLNQQGIF